ncbi:MAG: hypothetical protein ABI601_18600 [bacterium]
MNALDVIRARAERGQWPTPAEVALMLAEAGAADADLVREYEAATASVAPSGAARVIQTLRSIRLDD